MENMNSVFVVIKGYRNRRELFGLLLRVRGALKQHLDKNIYVRSKTKIFQQKNRFFSDQF